jgi:hypothetical protein
VRVAKISDLVKEKKLLIIWWSGISSLIVAHQIHDMVSKMVVGDSELRSAEQCVMRAV